LVRFAAASARFSAEPKCSKNACDPCFSDLKLQFTWMYNAQELLLCAYFLNAPCALLVALWGMTHEFSAEQMVRLRTPCARFVCCAAARRRR
jgi:hypothetical protein